MNEPVLLKTIDSLMADSGFRVDFALLTHCYVMLKSKPLIVLCGPLGSGKSTFVHCLARILVNENPRQFQSMIGHAWWAGKTGNVALLTEAQTRLNTGKLMLLVDEARRPKNADRIYLACLNKISPAEASGFFSEVAFQIQHERLMRLPSYHFTEPVPYPRNLSVIGTMDGQWRNGIDDDFRQVGSVIMWQADPVQKSANPPAPVDVTGAQAVFLESRVDDPQVAEKKLASLAVDASSAIQSVSRITDLLFEDGNRFRPALLDRAVIYLANAWSNDGCGLFAEQRQDNLEMALDSLIARDLLQPALEQMSEPGSRISQLKAALDGGFAQGHHLLDKFSDGH